MVLLVLWLLGFSLHVAGGLIHLLVVALVVLVINLLSKASNRNLKTHFWKSEWSRVLRQVSTRGLISTPARHCTVV